MSQNIQINLSELTPAHRRANILVFVLGAALVISPVLSVIALLGMVGAFMGGNFLLAAILILFVITQRRVIKKFAAANAKKAAAMNLAWMETRKA